MWTHYKIEEGEWESLGEMTGGFYAVIDQLALTFDDMEPKTVSLRGYNGYPDDIQTCYLKPKVVWEVSTTGPTLRWGKDF